MDLGGQAQAEFGVGAGNAPRQIDPLTPSVSAHLRADSFDESRTVHPRGVGEGGEAEVVSRADIAIHGIKARRKDSHQDLFGSGLEIGQVFAF